MSEKDKIKRTSQYMDNMSFDETYGQNAVEILTENAGGTELERQKTIATEETLQAVETNQTDGTQKTQIVDAGGEAVTVTGGKLDVNASVDTTGLATSAKQLADNHQVTVSNFPATQPISGTVTANLGATDNAVLDAIEVDTTAIAGAVSGTEMQVDVVTMPTTTVQATNLDIRDLANATDSVAIYGSDDGGTTKRIIKTDAGGAIQIDLEVASVTANAGTNLNTSALALDATLADLLAFNGVTKIMYVDVASATVTYQGWASPGTATSAASWRIRKITVSGNITSILYADGDTLYNNIWDNRAALSYS